MRYNFSQATLRDLGVGIGAQYSGSKVPWFTRAFEVPGYTIMDLAIFYTPSKANMQLALNELHNSEVCDRLIVDV